MNYDRDENFVGFNPVNWYGVVEDRDDPLGMGRLRVRIFGWHSLDKNVAPTNLLPWSQIQLSVNGSTTFNGPKVNEWVTGYFIDGAGGQFPVVCGVIPGINLELKSRPEGAPKPPDGILLESQDTPSTPPLARGVVENSLIERTNNDLEHVCDISLQVKEVVGWIKVKFGYVVNLIREQIRAILKALGLDATGESSALVSYLKKIASFIKRVSDILTEVQNWRDVILEVARIAKSIIDWILNLPKKFLELLRNCLSNLYKAIAGGFKEILSIGIDGADSDESVGKAIDEIKNSSTILINQVTDLASTPVQLIGVLTKPSDPNNILAVQNYINSQSSISNEYTEGNFNINNAETV